MKTKTTNKPNGAPKRAETEQLADAWMAWLADGSKTHVLGEAAMQAIRKQIPGGLLQGQEDDVRQNAAELLFEKFLLGNGELLAATVEGNAAEIARQIERSSLAAGTIALRRHRQHAGREAQRRERLAQAVERGELIIAEPHEPEMPPKTKAELALAGLSIAVANGEIGKINAELTRSILAGEKSQALLAREHGISRAAVCRRMQRTALSLRNILNREKEEI